MRSILTQIATKMVEKILDYLGEGGLADICSNTKETDEYVYPIDAIIGLEERERLSKELLTLNME